MIYTAGLQAILVYETKCSKYTKAPNILDKIIKGMYGYLLIDKTIK